MKRVELTETCTGRVVEIDGRSLGDYTLEEKRELVRYLAERFIEDCENYSSNIVDIFDLFQYDECDHDDEPCEQCGHHWSETIYKL